ncbi:hypothetical protein BGZ82_004133 [Podila clonocystis]|nr:hypothetical protein BGZ82_004133 [Podila clonocystis]
MLVLTCYWHHDTCSKITLSQKHDIKGPPFSNPLNGLIRQNWIGPSEEALLIFAVPSEIYDKFPVQKFNVFSVKIPSNDSVDDLKGEITAKKTNDLSDVDTDKLILWRVAFHLLDDVDDDDDMPIPLNTLTKKKLRPAMDLDEVFNEGAPPRTAHIIVQRSSPGSTRHFH